MGRRNDVSFLVGGEQVLWEQQSTPNLNMPLRGLLYFAKLYERYVEANKLDLYRDRRVDVPRPMFYVFYIGDREAPERFELLFSDGFAGLPSDIEVRAHVVNVNRGANKAIVEACPAMAGYSELVCRVRENREIMSVEDAVIEAIDSCIADGYLVDYLVEKRAEVKSMFMTDWDEDRYREMLREWAMEEGREEGREQGREEGIERMALSMRELGIPQDTIDAVLAGAAETPVA